MKKAFRILSESFYSRMLYKDAAHVWQGTGIGALACLLLLMYIVFMPIGIWKFANTLDYTASKQHLIDQIPVMTIENGVLSIDKPTPYHITSRENDLLATIDTRPETAAKDVAEILHIMKAEKSRIFMGQKYAISLDSNGTSKVYPYSEWSEVKVSFDKITATEMVKKAEIVAAPIIMVTLYGVLLLYAIIQMLLYSLGALILNKIAQGNCDYAALQRITVCALTPASLLLSLVGLFDVDISFFVCFIITLGYIYFGIRSAKTA